MACVRKFWYDFGSLAGNTDLFVQVISHIAAAAVPNPVLQYLKAGQITPLVKPTGGHRLLMMSFLRGLAVKSVMAAKKESVAKCAGPLQYGVGRPDGANTMIKTFQYLAAADNSRVLVALDLKAAFHITNQVLNSSPTWTTGICGPNHSTYYRQLLSLLQPPDQSTLLYIPPRHKYGKALARTPSHLSFKTRSHSHSVSWEDIYKSMETLSPALLFWESRQPWRKQHHAFRKLPLH